MRRASSHFAPTFGMRGIALLLWLVGCADLLGVEDGREQNSCTSKQQCAPGYECLLGICRDDCTADEQCGVGARCLRTIGTSACIPGSEDCGDGDTCPSGTTCIEHACRTECAVDAECSGGQKCESRLCVGQDSAHDEGLSPVGGSAGAGHAGSGGTPAAGGVVGTAGTESPPASAGEGGGGAGPVTGEGGAGGEPVVGPKACSPLCEGATPLCDDGTCKPPPSCSGAPTVCGPLAASKCCEAGAVPGGSVLRSYDGVTDDGMDATNAANISKFSLDLLEVTVGRFRRFVSAGGGVHGAAPEEGAGAVGDNAASGWKSAYTDELLVDKNALVSALACHPFATWTNQADTTGNGEARPINCVTWYEAQAFCIWDGGRLATEAEFNYVAAGGQQRVYPWSVPADSESIGCEQASLYLNDAVKCCAFDEKPSAPSCSAADIVVAGSKSGKGFWGQRDLGGNVQEWVADYYAPNYQNPCDDCVQTSTSTYRVLRGGSYFTGPTGLTASARDASEPFTRAPDIGFRCAYGH